MYHIYNTARNLKNTPQKRYRMRTRRPIVINNSLCHGICNYNCQLCSVNKPTYNGQKAFQPLSITKRIIELTQSAASNGISIGGIHQSGAGEPTLHPQFRDCMELFGNMVRRWPVQKPVPEIAVVTNGSNLIDDDVIAGLVENPVTVYISFPTAVPEAYGRLMLNDQSRGKEMMAQVTTGISELMRKKSPNKLYFNISPPDRDIIRRDFERTIDLLTKLAKFAGLDFIQLVMFTATSNRGGRIKNKIRGVDSYKDFISRFSGEIVNDVKVFMTTELERFFPRFSHLVDFIRSFDYPCLWNGNLLIAADGRSICSNDQVGKYSFGHVMETDIEGLMSLKERHSQSKLCAACDASPQKLYGSPAAILFNFASRIRIQLARLGSMQGKNDIQST